MTLIFFIISNLALDSQLELVYRNNTKGKQAKRNKRKGERAMEAVDLEKTLITEDELCRMLGISRITSWRLRKAGKLPYTKLDKGIRYTHAQVRNFLRARARGFSTPAQAA
ncbi:MAG: hypothetical protein AUG51_08505 [Acidobacteria bacterium 13_1_20CM_3_53_8]|nr:MAG: hypothetical protein AUG51_08505 [Acidobacteria bacterium 13_1_20CM_3_53_8]